MAMAWAAACCFCTRASPRSGGRSHVVPLSTAPATTSATRTTAVTPTSVIALAGRRWGEGGTAGTVVGDEAGGRSGVAVARRSDTRRAGSSVDQPAPPCRGASGRRASRPTNQAGTTTTTKTARRADHHAAATRWPTTRMTAPRARARVQRARRARDHRRRRSRTSHWAVPPTTAPATIAAAGASTASTPSPRVTALTAGTRPRSCRRACPRSVLTRRPALSASPHWMGRAYDAGADRAGRPFRVTRRCTPRRARRRARPRSARRHRRPPWGAGEGRVPFRACR